MTRIPRVSKAKLVKLQKDLVTDSAIGEELGITRQAVHQWRKKWGVGSSMADNSDRNASMIEAYNAGETGTAIARKFKLSISQTYRVINAAKDKAKRAADKALRRAGRKGGR
jgi:transposase-like protein